MRNPRIEGVKCALDAFDIAASPSTSAPPPPTWSQRWQSQATDKTSRKVTIPSRSEKVASAARALLAVQLMKMLENAPKMDAVHTLAHPVSDDPASTGPAPSFGAHDEPFLQEESGDSLRAPHLEQFYR
jgi:hypothetical protein